MNTKTKSKNKQAILVGVLAGIIGGFFLPELFQTAIAYLTGAMDFNFSFTVTGLVCNFTLPAQTPIWWGILIYLLPLLCGVIFYEIGMVFLNKSQLGILRYSTIVFEIILAGYIIIYVFYGAISVILKLQDNDWVNTIKLFNFGYESGIIFMFFVIILLSVYLNFSAKRISKFINV